MKAICRECGQLFEVAPVVFEKGSEVEKKSNSSFSLIPEHPAAEGKKSSSAITTGGALIRTFCDGSYRPAKVFPITQGA